MPAGLSAQQYQASHMPASTAAKEHAACAGDKAYWGPAEGAFPAPSYLQYPDALAVLTVAVFVIATICPRFLSQRRSAPPSPLPYCGGLLPGLNGVKRHGLVKICSLAC